ncbi:MAG: SUMF1/EgtB/PvdO family nonheme iron enzyme [Acidobacteriota bacterium]
MGEDIIFGNYIGQQHKKTDGVIEIYAGELGLGRRSRSDRALPEGYARNPDVVKRFYWEATVLDTLRGAPCVVPLLDRGTSTTGMPYYVLPLYESSLSAVVQRADRFPMDDRLNIAKNVLQGLAAAHAKGVVHRNLRPASIVLDTRNRLALLSDFGLAKAGSQDLFSPDERTFDDAQYSSPEQGEMKPVDQRSDVYAAGAILYELLGGGRPFTGDTTEAIQVNKLDKGPRPLRQSNPQVTPPVEALVHKAMSRDPAERFADGGEMLAALEAALRPAPAARPAPSAGRPAPGKPARPAGPRPGVPQLDLGLDREDEIAKVNTGGFELGDRTDAFTRDMLGHKDPSHTKQRLIIVGILVAAVLGVIFFFARGYKQQAEVDRQAEEERIKREQAEKNKQELAKKKGDMQTAADEAQKSGDLAAAIGKHDEVLALDPADEVSKAKKAELTKKQDLVKSMILIPGGQFRSGIDPEQVDELVKKVGAKADQLKAAVPEQKYVDAFFIDRREVTNAEYKQFVEATKHPVPVGTGDDADFSWKNGTYPEGKGDSPVMLVSWEDALAYCKWAGKRLPTSLEWERAARGNERYLFPWGNGWEPGHANTGASNKDGPEPVGSYPTGASPFGMLDAVGNVAEWTADLYGDGSRKLAGICGSSWADEDGVTPLPIRFSQEVGAKKATTGFRCAVTP